MASTRTLARVSSHLAGAALLAVGLLTPMSALAQEPTDATTGSFTGSVTCGVGSAPVAGALVDVEGANLQTRTDDGGRFTLTGLPAGQTFTVDALSGSFATSLPSVPVEIGQTLDIGSLDVAVCAPQPLSVPADQPNVDGQGAGSN